MDNDPDKIITAFSQLLIKSEERIDRTNNMIVNGLTMIDHLSKEYTSHLNALRNARDKLIEENKALASSVENLTLQLNDASKRYESLLNRLIDVTTAKSKSENNFNIK